MNLTRPGAALSIAVFNKYTKSIAFAAKLGKEDIVRKEVATVTDYKELEAYITAYIKEDPDSKLFKQLIQLTDTESIDAYIKQLPKGKLLDDLVNIVESIRNLQHLGYYYLRMQYKDYPNLIPELANDTVEQLLSRAVQNGLLTKEYKPKPETRPFQLTLIAYAIIQLAGLKYRNSWCLLERQWGLGAKRLTQCDIPITKGNAIYKIMQLYPEVNFYEFISPKKDTRETMQSDLTQSQAEELFLQLQTFGYISNRTQKEQFLSMMNIINLPFKPIDWTGSFDSLVYFVKTLFDDKTPKILCKTVTCFTLQGGKSINKGTLKSKSSYVFKHLDDYNFVPEIDSIIYSSKKH